MKWYNPITWFRKPKPEPEIKETIKEAEGFFSTHLDRRLDKKDLSLWIAQNAFRKTSADIKPINKKGEAIAMDSAVAMDDCIKSAFSLSSAVLPQNLFAWYVSQGFIGYQACAVIAQNAVVSKCCTIPARDAIKNGYDLTVDDGTDVDLKQVDALRKLDKKYKIKSNLIELERFKRVFGIRIALFDVDSEDEDYYLKPFNIDGVKKGSYKGISQVDPYWITPELDEDSTSNPASKHFYEPTWWRINGKRYHRSHLIVVRNAEVPDVLKPSYVYGGLPLTQLIYERVYAAERTANEAPLLALTKRVNVMKVDIEKAMANQKSFEEKMNAFNQYRDNYGIQAIGKEEEFQQTETNLSDLDSVIMTNYQLVAMLAGMPATKLVETSPKGFSATGEYEKESYYDTLETIQEDTYELLLDRHYLLLIKSQFDEQFEVNVQWKPLDSPTAKELAEIREIDSRTDINLMTAGGAIDGTEVRNRVIADPNSGYSGLEPHEDLEYEDDPEDVELL